jgi:small subunit ribosomal protein S17
MDKTAVVSVERREPHPLYRKIVRSTKRYKAHDPNNTAVLGDIVVIVETRPLSKEKHWRIAQTLTRGNVAEIAPRDIGVPEEALATLQPPPAPVAATELAADVEEAAVPESAVAESALVDSPEALAAEPEPPAAKPESPDSPEASAAEPESPESPADEAESPDSPDEGGRGARA